MHAESNGFTVLILRGVDDAHLLAHGIRKDGEIFQTGKSRHPSARGSKQDPCKTACGESIPDVSPPCPRILPAATAREVLACGSGKANSAYGHHDIVCLVDVSGLPADDFPADIGATRLAYLDGQTSLLAVAPRGLLDRQPNYEFDPLPPPEEENIFTGVGTRLPWQNQSGQQDTESSDIEARMRNLFGRNAGPVPAAGGVMGIDQDDEVDLGGLDIEDEELRRDLEEHARGGDGAGLFATLMQLLSGGRGDRTEDTGIRSEDGDEWEEEAEGLPGSWPEDDTDNETGHAPNNQY